MNILFTCAGRRAFLLSAFRRALGCTNRIVAADMSDSAPAFHYADVAYKVPSVTDPDYIDALLRICKQESIELVVPLHDAELPILASHRSAFEKMGALCLVSDTSVIDRCFDKMTTCTWLTQQGFSTPLTVNTVEEAEQHLQSGALQFPLVVKPRWGMASTGITLVHEVSELHSAFAHVQSLLEPHGELDPAGSSGSLVIVQQCVEGEEYGIDCLNDLQGKTQYVSAKKKLRMRAGESDRVRIALEKDLLELGSALGNRLQHVGNLDVDVIKSGDTLHLIDLNPRFGGGYPFSHTAGVDYPSALVAWAGKQSFDCSIFAPRDGVVFAKNDEVVEVNSAAVRDI